MRKRWVVGGLLATAACAAVVGGAATRASAAPGQAKLTKITLQLKWVPQAQFAGYYAASLKGFYKAAGLDVTLKNGGPNIIPEQVVASGLAQFGVDWLPSLLAARDKGTQLVNVAQVFARSGMTQLTWKSSGIDTIAKMKGKKVANWLGGNQYELFAALTKAGMNPEKSQGVTIVQQPFDMNLFLKHQVDSASAMTYNELAQVLETGVKLSQINVIKMQNAGTGMLEDGLFSTASWLSSKANQATAVKFIAASLAGWIYCRDHQAECVQLTLREGPTLPKGHQTWMMNEINKLIWPSSSGIGIMNTADYTRTAQISKQFGVIKKAPSGAYRTDLAKAAVAQLKKQGLDVYGKSWKPLNVKVTPGGK
ncbi:MAG TPA: ABC transporter substrate-binding protein [Gaiellaceae bacterium]|nr:ABC transporter substrate-binding protein [Gaiellaceae bacterium]